MNTANLKKPIACGLVATVAMLALYFLVVGAISGWPFATSQFVLYWYFIISMATGFGVQIGLFSYIKQLVVSGRGSGKVLGVTGATSTAAMVSCCAHYLTNILQILGTVGLVTFLAQYQIQFFWVGLVFNAAGIIYMIYKIQKVKSV